MSRHVLIDFRTEGHLGREFDSIKPIGILMERADGRGFESRYLPEVTEDQDAGHDNYVRTMQATDEFRDAWNNGFPVAVTVGELFTYLADQSYLGTRFRSLGMVDDGVTIEDAYRRYVVGAEPLPVLDDEELPSV